MKSKRSIGFAFAVGSIFLVWLTHSLLVKSKYNQVPEQLGALYHVAPMSEEMDAFLAEVRETWTERVNFANGPHAGWMETIGLAPSMSNLLHMLTHPMPPYSWFFPQRNWKTIRLGVAQDIIRPNSIDQTVHLCADGHSAMIRCTTNSVYVFVEDADAFHELLYVKP